MTRNTAGETRGTASSSEGDSSPRIVRSLQLMPKTAGAILTVGGLVVLAGWTFRVELLKSIVPGFASMKANTAFGFIASGIALMLISQRGASPTMLRTGKAFAGAAGLIGLLSFVEDSAGVSLGIDQAIFVDFGGRLTPTPGRMAISTAATFVFLALALVIADPAEGKRSRLLQPICVAGCVFPFLALVGYSFGVEGLYKPLPTQTAQALHTAALFLLGFAGAITIGPPRGLIAEFASEQLGGRLARRLLPVALLMPLLVAWVRLAGEKAGLYSTEFGLAIMVTAMTLALCTLTYFATAFLNKSDSERQVAHAAEHDLARRLQGILARSTSLVFMKDLDGRYVMASHSLEKALSLAPSELIGHTDTEVLPPSVAEALSAGDVTALTQGHASERELELITDGGIRQYLMVKFPLLNDDGTPNAICGIASDITDRRQVEDVLRSLNDELEARVDERTRELAATIKELEAFSYSVSHDLRSPLRAMDGFSRILIDEHSEDLSEDALRYLRRIREGAQQMGQLIDDLLAFSRIGRQSLEYREFELTEIVAEAFEVVRAAEPEERDIELKIMPMASIRADRTLMKQVFVNLLSNAVKYSRANPKTVIEVRCEKRAGARSAVCSVRDNGVGFELQYAERIFGVFQRLHNAAEYEGTGVGLAIVQRVIQLHGGEIWAESTPGLGATFYFTIAEGGQGDEG